MDKTIKTLELLVTTLINYPYSDNGLYPVILVRFKDVVGPCSLTLIIKRFSVSTTKVLFPMVKNLDSKWSRSYAPEILDNCPIILSSGFDVGWSVDKA